MNGNAHRLFGAASWVTVSATMGLPGWQTAAGVIPAVAFSAGPTSPDIDNTRTWKRLDRWIPDELLGDGGPLGHRQFLHWIGLPIIGAWVVWHFAAGTPLTWAAYAAIVGWASHIVSDAVYGQGGYGTAQGVPLGPWFWHFGLGFKSDGLAQHLTILPISLGMVWVALGHPGA